MNRATKQKVYEFDDFRIDVDHRMLYRGGDEIPMFPKAVETLLALVERRGEIVSKEELLEAVWPDAVVEESNLFFYLSLLRKNLGTLKDGTPYVETLRRRGYRFNGDVRLVEEATEKDYVVSSASHSEKNVADSGQLYVVKDGDRGRTSSVQIGSSSAKVPALIAVRASKAEIPEDDNTTTDVPVGFEISHQSTAHTHVNRSSRTSVMASLLTAVLMIASVVGLSYWRSRRAVSNVHPPGDRLQKRYTNNSDAKDYYDHARYNQLKLTEEGLRQALTLYEKAIQADPNYALAYAHLADTYRTLGATGFERLKEMYPNVRRLTARALELDSSLAEAYVQLGYVESYDKKPTAAETFKKAIELGPDDPQAHIGYAFELLNSKKNDEAVAEARLARELGARTLIVLALESDILLRAKYVDESIIRAQKTLEIDPNFWVAHYHLGRAFAAQDRYPEAISEFEKTKELVPESRLSYVPLATAYAKIGYRTKAIEILQQIERRQYNADGPFVGLAVIYNELGDKSKALDLLEKAVDGEEALVVIKNGKAFDNLRSEPRFKNLLGRIELLGK